MSCCGGGGVSRVKEHIIIHYTHDSKLTTVHVRETETREQTVLVGVLVAIA
jgi:hypothetical protein